MNVLIKRCLSLALALLLVFGAAPGGVSAEEASDGEAPKTIEKVPYWKRPKTGRPVNDWTDTESTYYWYSIGKTFKHTGDWRRDLLCLAVSQVGYQESKSNYREDAAGVKHGYTRYGAWYGNPYGEWCAMFVSFCLNYTGIPKEVVPHHANCAGWVTQLWRKGLFVYAANADPKPGDLVFLGRDTVATHVAIVCDVNAAKNELTLIQGNTDHVVSKAVFPLNSLGIIGYCVLPQNPARSPDTPPERLVRALAAALARPEDSIVEAPRL